MATDVSYFEDVVVGEAMVSPSMTLTPAHVALYRGLCGESMDDVSEIPTLLPLCMSTGLAWRVDRPPLAVQAFVGFEWQSLRALRIGDTIHTTSRAALLRRLRDGGLVVEDHEIVDQRGEIVQRGRFTFLVARRPATDA